MPFVRHTFLHVGPTPGAERNGTRRCVSLSPRGNRDSFATHFHALLYKPTPVQLPTPARSESHCCGTVPRCEEEVVDTQALRFSGIPCKPDVSETQSTTTRLRWSDEEEAETHSALHLASGRYTTRNVAKPAQPAKRPPCDPVGEAGEDDRSTEAGSTADIGELSFSSRESSYSSAIQGDQEDDPDEEELLRRVPSDENGNPMSIGSIAHEAGTCKPCVFAYNTKKACANGTRCSFCHFVHPPKMRVRLCKKKRMDIKRAQEAEQEEPRWR